MITTPPNFPHAVISNCGRYRYTLWRTWNLEGALFAASPLGIFPSDYVLFVLLNPSTADGIQDDPTIRRCIAFAKSWGYQKLCVANLFAFRATDPEAMKAEPDPIGPENDSWLEMLAAGAHLIVAGWGQHGKHLDRAATVMKALTKKRRAVHALKFNSDGNPGHPLYLSGETRLLPFPIVATEPDAGRRVVIERGTMLVRECPVDVTIEFVEPQIH